MAVNIGSHASGFLGITIRKGPANELPKKWSSDIDSLKKPLTGKVLHTIIINRKNGAKNHDKWDRTHLKKEAPN